MCQTLNPKGQAGLPAGYRSYVASVVRRRVGVLALRTDRACRSRDRQGARSGRRQAARPQARSLMFMAESPPGSARRHHDARHRHLPSQGSRARGYLAGRGIQMAPLGAICIPYLPRVPGAGVPCGSPIAIRSYAASTVRRRVGDLAPIGQVDRAIDGSGARRRGPRGGPRSRRRCGPAPGRSRSSRPTGTARRRSCRSGRGRTAR
jgi:hypothetical protein